jgi:uncharacterized phage-like protein YoqJ
MTEEEEIEDTEEVDKMEQTLDHLRRDRVDDLASTASLLGSWMSEKKYTIAEQLSILELLRSSILVNYIRLQQMEGMAKFIAEHPEAKVVVVDAQKPPAPRPPHTSHPDRN